MRFLTYGIVLATLAAVAHAAPITYTETGQLSGTLSGVALTNVNFTFTLIGNTANVTGTAATSFNNIVTSNAITVGASNGTFTTAQAIDTASNGVVGIANQALTAGLTLQSASAVGYNLATAISVSAAASHSAFGTFATSFGNLVITSAQNLTFTATVTPEPGTALLSLTSLLALAGAAYRRTKRS